MRFKRSDMPGMLAATVGPVLLMLILLQSFQLWDHHGSPILAILAMHIAIGGGLIGAFARFIRARDALLGLLLGLVLCVVGVLALQASDNDGTLPATMLKLGGVFFFLALNVLVVWQILANGLNPVLVRRDERRAEAAEESA